MKNSSLNKTNPSRLECEGLIRKILRQEIQQKGRNSHFKHSVDFLPFFESLYPTSESLSKQVQRAMKRMDLPKDYYGYYIINRSRSELELEAHLLCFFQYESFCVSIYQQLENDKGILLLSGELFLYHYCFQRLQLFFSYSDFVLQWELVEQGILITGDNLIAIQEKLTKLGIQRCPQFKKGQL